MIFNLEYTRIYLIYIPVVLILIWFVTRTFVKFRNKKEKEQHIAAKKTTRTIVIILRSLIILLLFIAISSPHTSQTRQIPGDYSLTILADDSASMKLFKEKIAEELKSKISSEIPSKVRYIAYGNESAVGNALLNSMQGNDNIIVITDGNVNKGKELGDVLLLASSMNTTVSSLDIEPDKDDTAIKVSGPLEIIFGNDYTYYIDISQVGLPKQYKLELYINGEPVYQAAGIGSKTFTHTPEKWLLEGYHEIVGKLIINNEDDYFNENNIYYKTVHVYQKPKILFISKTFPRIERVLERVYTYHMRTAIPKDLSEYPVIVLNDMPASEIKPHIDRLINYASKGNGIVVLGGKNSFEYGGYKGSLFEALLPVVVGIAGKKKEESDINIVIVIDISGTTTYGASAESENTKISVQKAHALEILKNLNPDAFVGAAAFDTKGYYLTPNLLPLREQRTINQTISSIKSEPTAGTFIYAGLDKADWLLYNAKGAKNVILISDGITSLPEQAYQKARTMSSKGVKIYTLGVGDDVNEGFMKELANVGKGAYYKATEKDKLVLLFKDPKKDEKKETDINQLMIIDSHHWITDNLEINARVTGFNQVAPKSSARTLITTGEMRPILTTWRFGLGRIAVISTDTEMWAGELLSRENSELITRTINWAIWDPDKNKDFYVKAKDTNLGSLAEINVYSKKFPESKKLQFSKIGKNAYKSTFIPVSVGFLEVFNTKIAVNFNKEFETIGLNPELSTLVSLTGGQAFNLNETKDLINFVKDTSKRTKTDIKYYRWPFIIAAMLIFLVEILIRRIREDKGL